MESRENSKIVTEVADFTDTKAIEKLILMHQKRIYTSIILMVKDKSIADDIFQDTFFKVIGTLKEGKYQEEGKFLQWTLRIAYNLCIDHFRRLKKSPTISKTEDGTSIFDFLDLKEDSIEETLIKSQINERIKELVNMLPLEQREVLVLRHFAGLSFKEIAEITKVSINTALGRMRYAITNLKKLIEQYKVPI
jgi:RNA polymerase sigma-70 factor (ECF subfamily)